MHICRSCIINVDTKFHGKIDHMPSVQKGVVFLCSSHIIKFIIFFVKKNDKQFAFFCVAHILSSFSTKTVSKLSTT